MNRYKIILTVVFSFFLFFISFSQASSKSIEINERIDYVNSLIWHVNYNIMYLKKYQDELGVWAKDPSRRNSERPKFSFVPSASEKLKVVTSGASNAGVLDYDFQLKNIETHTSMLNSLFKKIEILSISNDLSLSNELFLKNTSKIIRDIKNQLTTLAETAYDFSKACTVSHKPEKYPTELFKVKEVIANSKNLIQALRDYNTPMIREYISLLDNSLEIMEKTTQVPELYSKGEISLSLDETYILLQGIYKKVLNMSILAESFLGAINSNKESTALLQEIISEFNATEGKLGCGTSFNKMLRYSSLDLMLFTEEPSIILVEKINFVKRDKDLLEIAKSDEEETTISAEKFDKKKKNTLVGSLPNNLILLLDISASMKQSGKLPILKKSLEHFLNIMREEDKVSLISYSGEAKVLISGATMQDKNTILDTLANLKSSGGSDIFNALLKAYQVGEKHFIPNGNNKIIIATDGIFGVDLATLEYVNNKAAESFSLSIFQYSSKNEEVNFKSLKKLAESGKGSYKIMYNSVEAIDAMMLEIKKQNNTD